MRILCVCDEGNSRSPTIASILRYSGHDTLAVGASRASDETRRMLADWCDLAVFTAPGQVAAFPGLDGDRVMVWPIADVYPRPFNAELRKLVLSLAVEKGLA